MSSGADWDRALTGTGDERTAEFRRALDAASPALDSLITDVRDGISAEAWGYQELGDIADVEQRAVVSDQLLSAVGGLQDALVDAAINSHDFHEHTGPTGLPYWTAGESLNDMLRYERLRRVTPFLALPGELRKAVASRGPPQRRNCERACGFDPVRVRLERGRPVRDKRRIGGASTEFDSPIHVGPDWAGSSSPAGYTRVMNTPQSPRLCGKNLDLSGLSVTAQARPPQLSSALASMVRKGSSVGVRRALGCNAAWIAGAGVEREF